MNETYEKSLELWEGGNYEEALDMWKICLEKAEYTDDIVTSIQEAFLNPNEEEFVQELQKNRQILFGEKLTHDEALQKYHSLTIHYLCYAEDQYYIFDVQNKLLLGKFNLLEETGESNEFDDILVLYPQSIMDITDRICKKYKRNIYCLGEEKAEFDSVYCVPGLSDILEKRIIFFKDCKEEKEYFLKNKAVYIPKSIVGYAEEETVNEVLMNFEEVHNKRLEAEYRDDSNVLLTIGIPTYSRGKRALQNVLHTMHSLYDAEIEIVVSDNASVIQAEEYEKIANLPDARVKYYKAPENRGFIGNIQKIFEIASGKYVLLLSDEDLVIYENLSHYLSILRNNENLGILRGSRTGNENQVEYEPVFRKKGDEAFGHMFLYNNYLSGSIYICNDTVRDLIQELRTRYKDEVAFLYYPHMYLDVRVAEIYDVCDDKEYLIYTGEAEDGSDTSTGLIDYAKVERRIEQHTGWRKLLDDLEEISVEMKYNQYVFACRKMFYLVSMVRKYYVDEWEKTCRQIAEACAIEFENIHFLSEQQKDMVRDGFVEGILASYKECLAMQ